MNKAEIIINELGGVKNIAKTLKLKESTVYNWKRAKPKGCGGVIPYKHKSNVARLAMALGKANLIEIIWENDV